ncbi:MAG: AbrB family transcriptional regulator [Betaproteobacteria bacterium]
MPRIRTKHAASWVLLIIVSLPACWFLKSQGFPAAYLVGAMMCAIAFCLCGVRLALPRKLFYSAQALIGCSVANTITAAIIATIWNDWLVMSLIVGSTILFGGLLGWMLVKCRILPGTTAAWGSSPGGAAAMVAMAEDYGADARLVALMQYLRVLAVVLTASTVSHFLMQNSLPAAVAATPAIGTSLLASWQPAVWSLAVAVIGGFLGLWLRIPAGALLVPLILGSIVHSSELFPIELPFGFQAFASVLLGWYIGLGFNRDILASAFRMLPRLLLSTILLILLCSVSAWLMVWLLGTQPLTAYLATSPGGLDSIVLIAMGSEADIPFVVAVQTLRLFAVILIGPTIARLICRHA